jgi:hypothetical protein
MQTLSLQGVSMLKNKILMWMKNKGVFIDILIILLWVVLLVMTLINYRVTDQTELTGGLAIWGGVYINYIGLLFLLSYFSPNKSFIFRGLMWVCMHFSSPTGKKMAFFYALLAFVLGTLAILMGIGLIEM